MKDLLKQKWQSFVRFVQAFETGSAYPFEQIHELQLEVAKLQAQGSVCVVCAESERRI
ncbi:MAG: hypothetical protein O7F71_19120 [Gammaproteobacteria bacterium]|nr:hypothetical protein [Gammaproteobacteria bacterium]